MEHLLAYLVGLGLLLLLSAFFSGSETALFSLSRAQVQRLRKSGTRSGAAAARLLAEPQRLLITILVGNLFVNVAAASLVADLAKRLLGDEGVGAAIFVTTCLLLIAGEVTPKTFAVRRAEGFARFSARPLEWFAVAIWPLRAVLRGVTSALLFALRRGGAPADNVLTRDDLAAIVKAGAAEGVMEEHEADILENIFEFREILAHEIMTPRTAMVSVGESATVAEALAAAADAEHSRLPIYGKDEDDIWGVFHVKDLPAWDGRPIAEMTLKEFTAYRDGLADAPRFPLVHDAFLAPETAPLHRLFDDMRARRAHMAILLDEYGGAAGLVTLSDLLERIVGEMAEEEEEQPDFARRGDCIVARGEAKIRELNDELDLNLPTGAADTVAGYVLELLGDFPRPGQRAADGAYEFRVIKASPRRIELVEIRRLPAKEEGTEGAR